MNGTAAISAFESEERTIAREPANKSGIVYNVPAGYLRAFVTVLVLAHHAVLAYHPFAPPPAASLETQPRWWQAFPVVDSQRWTGFALFTGFNDIFFMSLMFFLSGLFVWSSLQRKGMPTFLRDRALRLGVPFVVAALVIAPVAYYPAYLMTDAKPAVAAFLRQWLSLGQWPAGPAWFIWVLLAFDCLAGLLYIMMPKWGAVLGGLTSGACRRPGVFFAGLVTISAVVYVPMAIAFTPISWTAFGPFTFQTSRLFHYVVYFAAGIAVGAYGINRGLLAPTGNLARRWGIWLFAAVAAFAVTIPVTVAAVTAHPTSNAWAALGGCTFVLSCAASSLALLAIFLRFAKSSGPLWDSLRDNAYGMYLIHYVFVTWLQYGLLHARLAGVSKGCIVFLCTLILSWCATAGLRRIPIVARIL